MYKDDTDGLDCLELECLGHLVLMFSLTYAVYIMSGHIEIVILSHMSYEIVNCHMVIITIGLS